MGAYTCLANTNRWLSVLTRTWVVNVNDTQSLRATGGVQGTLTERLFLAINNNEFTTSEWHEAGIPVSPHCFIGAVDIDCWNHVAACLWLERAKTESLSGLGQNRLREDQVI